MFLQFDVKPAGGLRSAPGAPPSEQPLRLGGGLS